VSEGRQTCINVFAELERGLLGKDIRVHAELGESCANMKSKGEWSKIAGKILDQEIEDNSKSTKAWLNTPLKKELTEDPAANS
jgi:hypothetical protein